MKCSAQSRWCLLLSCVGRCLLQVVDEGKNRAIQVEKEGFPDAVVWNPWIKKAAGMSDFGDEEYKVTTHSPTSYADICI